MYPRGRLALTIVLLLPAAAAAQKVEITPFVGFHFGGEFNEDADVFPSDFELDDTDSTGVILGIGVTRGLQVELLWSRQETELLEDAGLFGNDLPLFDLDLTYYHVGLSYQWKIGQVRPFAALSLGATELDPDMPDLDSETRLSVSFGGGVKLMFSNHLGVRVEGRLLATNISDDDDYCDRYCDDNDDLLQGVVRGGLVFAF